MQILVADCNTGAGLMSIMNNGWGLPQNLKIPPYIQPGLNFLNSVITGNYADQQGTGGHGSIMAWYYALLMWWIFGIPAFVIPCVTMSKTGAITDAIGRAFQWVAQQQDMMNRQGKQAQWVVTLPCGPGFAGSIERSGRAALQARGIPLFQSAGDNGMNINVPNWRATFATTSNAFIMSAVKKTGQLQPYSNYGGTLTNYATVPDAFGTSGAAMVAASYYSMFRIWNPTINSLQVADIIRKKGLLLGV